MNVSNLSNPGRVMELGLNQFATRFLIWIEPQRKYINIVCLALLLGVLAYFAYKTFAHREQELSDRK